MAPIRRAAKKLQCGTAATIIAFMQRTPASLLKRLRQSPDAAAWNRFAQLYTPLLFYWARRAGLQSEDAADLVQDVFAILVKKLPEFEYDPKHSFRGWLRRVTLNKWHERCRQNAPVQGLGDHEPAIADPAEEFWNADYRKCLAARALALMQSEFQTNTWKSVWETTVNDRSIDEVAKELGMTPGAVYAARCRVLARLREELDGLME